MGGARREGVKVGGASDGSGRVRFDNIDGSLMVVVGEIGVVGLK